MHPKYFGESHDMAKRQVMEWLAPKGPWAVHLMWFNHQREDPPYPNFPQEYERALGVNHLGADAQDRGAFLEAAQNCGEHLLLDPDTGLWTPGNNRHVTFEQFVQIVGSDNRQGKLTLIYDQSYLRDGRNVWEQTQAKLWSLRGLNLNIHAAAYVLHAGTFVRLIWASTDCMLITRATQRMQEESGYPFCRFVDDGCGHVGNNE